MKNRDRVEEQKKLFAQQLKNALDSKSDEAVIQAFETYTDNIQQILIETAREVQMSADSAILAQRGIRQLSAEESKFYSNLATAMKAEEPRQGLSGVDVTIPQTVVDTVLSDIESNHPLLEKINIQNTFGAVKWLYADDPQQLATWGKITEEIKKKLQGAIHEIKFDDMKLTAFLPVPKGLLDLAPAYLDAYVRRILADALAYGLEYGIIKGTGKDEPIGMVKNLKGAVNEGVYSDKAKVVLKDLGVKSYCDIVSQLAQKEGGKTRQIPLVTLIVNSIDYVSKIIPATTVLATDGTYKNNIFPFPTEVIQSEMVDQDTAIIGLLDRYVVCVSTGKEGKVEYSDQYQFLEDNRVYIIKLLGTGRAKDNNSFIYLDISKLEPLELSVVLKNATEATS